MKTDEIITWILILVAFSSFGLFLDYLFSTELRRKEKVKIQQFFSGLFEKIESTNFIEKQSLLIKAANDIEHSILKNSYVFIFAISLLISQYMSYMSMLACVHIAGENTLISNAATDYTMLIPFFPFVGAPYVLGYTDVHPLEMIGLYWNNFVFDTITITLTLYLLRAIRKKPILLLPIAVLNCLASYTFAYLCVFFYLATPPAVNSTAFDMPFFGFIPYLWSLKDEAGSYADVMFYSLTTFVPIALYMALLLFFHIAHMVKWVMATVAWDFAKDPKKTVFFKLSTSLSSMAVVLKALYEVLKIT